MKTVARNAVAGARRISGLVALLLVASWPTGFGVAVVSPAWAQAAAFDDAEAQLQVRQAATGASAAERRVETLLKELEAERQRVVQTDSEREVNQAAVKALEKELRSAEAAQREQEAKLKAAQEARARGVAAEAARRRVEEGQRQQANPPTAPTAPAPPAVAAQPSPPPAPPAAAMREAQELAAWNTIAGSTNPAMFETFLTQFPGGVFAPFARTRLAELRAVAAETARRAGLEAEARKRAETAAAAPTPAPTVNPSSSGTPPINNRRVFKAITTQGTEVLVSWHGNWGRNGCGQRPLPVIAIVDPPRNGRVVVRPVSKPPSDCSQAVDVDMAGVFYLPNHGFIGVDTFSYERKPDQFSSSNVWGLRQATVEVRP